MAALSLIRLTALSTGSTVQVQELAQQNKKFRVIDKAIGKNSFKIVTLLRLSPLLPLALSNYFYGLTSVDLPAYVAASWIGMLPGTVAYVTAGKPGQITDSLRAKAVRAAD